MARGVAIALAIAVVLVGGLAPRIARADNVDELIDKLEDSSDKVRLSAVLNLTRLGDARAIDPLVKRLENDSSKNVAGAAAKGLGTIVTPKVTGAQRARVLKALQDASNNHPAPFVQAQASIALKAIGATATPTPPNNGNGGTSPSGGAVYVNVGPMSSKTGNATDDAKFRALMVKVATKTMNRKAGNMPTTWPGGGVPSQAALTQKSTQGFYIDGTLTTLTVNISGSSATISCKVSMLLADFPNKSVFGFPNGSANVQGSSSPRDIELAREDCVSAVVEDLIQKTIIPTIGNKSGVTPAAATSTAKANP